MRRSIPSLLSLALLAALFCGHAAAQEFSSLEERMSYAEFKAAGLDKLTPEELENLNRWLAGRVQPAAVAPPAPSEDRRGFLSESGAAIIARIPGEFRGWREKGDRFVLDNGQVWEVLNLTSRLAVNLVDPRVTIEPGALGAWYMSVEGYNGRVNVRRVK
jgi:hypothetical protein